LLCLGGVLYYLFRKGDDTPPTGAAATTTAAPVTTGASATATSGAGTSVTTAPPTTALPATTPPAVTPGTGTLEMPNVVGMKGDQAESAIKAKGFTKVTFTSEDNKPVQILGDWIVTAQTPKAGDKAGADTEIILTVKSTDQTGGGKG
jgi:hypothetical protein